MGTYTHSRRSVLTCVLMCVDLHVRTLRDTGIPVKLCFTDNTLKKLDIYGNAVLVQFSSVTQSCPTLCDPMNHSMTGLPVPHQFSESTQTHVH